MSPRSRSTVQATAARSLRVVLCLWAALALGVLPARTALAQETKAQISLAKTGVTVARKTTRGEAQFPFYLSHQDCIEDATFTFLLKITSLTNTKGKTLQMWVSGSGVDCTDNNVRNTQDQCGLVAETSTFSNLSGFQIEAKAQDIVRAFARKNTDAPANGSDADCKRDIENNVVFQFFIVESTSVVSNSATWKDTQIDLVGPPAPFHLTAGIGEEKLILDWDVDDAAEVKDTQSFNFYCDVSGPPPSTQQGEGGAASGVGLGGSAGSIGVGTGTAGEGGGGDDGTSKCPPGRLDPGTVPEDQSLRCGSVRGIATRSGKAEPLDNFTTYAVAVSAVDQVGNAGPLSNVACGTPEPTISFYDAYREAGGQGGGGYCALGAVPAPGAFGALALAGVTLIARRRRPRA